MRKAQKFALAIGVSLVMAFTLSCSSNSEEESGGLGKIDCKYEGETVTIGNQTWMAENLNCNVAGSKCYDNNQTNCDKYGRLYNWETAMKVCPNGWHLPTQAEWNTLTSFIQTDKGCSSCDAKHLKATSGWNNSLDSYGFAALPGGYGHSGGDFYNVGDTGYWWSASEDNAGYAYFRSMDYNEYAGWSSYGESFLRSVRCVKD